MGQMLWFAVAKDEKGGYGKCMKNLRLRPVVLSAELKIIKNNYYVYRATSEWDKERKKV